MRFAQLLTGPLLSTAAPSDNIYIRLDRRNTSR